MDTHDFGRLSLLCLSMAIGSAAGGVPQLTFPSPSDAAAALLAAVETSDYQRFLSIAGTRMTPFWTTGDPERNTLDRQFLVDAARRRGIRIASQAEGRADLYVGDISKPFPAPLVLTEAGWRFDEDAGAQELATRAIRRNEGAIVDLCRQFREAQYAYLSLPRDGVRTFAAKIRSAPGGRDGLFWSAAGEEDQSPLGPAFAAAAYFEHRPDNGALRPLFGYYFKILTAQGPAATGGALDYRANGALRRGFALVAWPAEYGIGGFRSFLMNHFGDVFQKDLGPDGARIVAGMSAFNPDRGWGRASTDD
jgi:hypothetical protein